MTYGLVLGGGGVRGAYHIGVWKAIVELGIDVCAVCGTSIGAINAAMFVASDLETAQRMWESIALSDVVSLPDDNMSDLFEIRNIVKVAKELKNSKGLDMTPLSELIRGVIDEESFFSSPIDFGLVTYSRTDKKECPVYKSQIPKGKLVEYLMASACLPGFKGVVIDNSKFLDGALTNNMPVDMLINLGIKDIITVDVKGIGFYKEFNTAGRNIISIECKRPHTGTMEFDDEGVSKMIGEGYFDTLSAFGKIKGGKYYIKNEDYLLAKSKYSDDIIEGIFSAAEIFEIDNLRIWDFDELLDRVMMHYSHIELTNEITAMLNENKFDISRISEFKKDSQKLYILIRMLQSEGFDFIKSRIDKILGKYYMAASSIIYFSQKYTTPIE